MRYAHIAILGLGLMLAGCQTPMGERLPRAAHEPKSIVNTDQYAIALEGYDPVAYFTDHRPIKGVITYTSNYDRATYWFVSADHKQIFDADPAKYAPQFGGYCAYAASINKISPVSPDYWEIIDGRLVLQHNQKAWNLWHQDPAGNLRKADANWPGLVAMYGD